MLEGFTWFGSKEERAKKNALSQERLARSVADYEAAKAEVEESHQNLNKALEELENLPAILAEDKKRREEERAKRLAELDARATHRNQG
jgi:hypothetical protein